MILSTAPLRAQTFGAQLDYFYSTTAVDGRRIGPAPGMSAPAPIADRDPRLGGSGAMQGGVLRVELLLDELRLGTGVSLYGVSGVDVRTDPLEPGASVGVSSMWGEGGELSLGYEFLRGPVYGYFDFRGSFNVLSVKVETSRAGESPMNTMYNAYVFGFGPRLGALVPIGHSTMLDVGVYQRIIGDVSQTMFFAGLGYWQNERRDPFSEELKSSWRGDF